MIKLVSPFNNMHFEFIPICILWLGKSTCDLIIFNCCSNLDLYCSNYLSGAIQTNFRTSLWASWLRKSVASAGSSLEKLKLQKERKSFAKLFVAVSSLKCLGYKSGRFSDLQRTYCLGGFRLQRWRQKLARRMSFWKSHHHACMQSLKLTAVRFGKNLIFKANVNY